MLNYHHKNTIPMKIKLLILPLVAIVVAAGSCVKNPETPQPDGPRSGPGTVKEMAVPAGFDWKMSRGITCNFASAHLTRVYVASTADAEPFAVVFAGDGAEPVTLDVPTSVKSLYVKYEKADGTLVTKELPVMGTTLAYTVPADSKEFVDVAAGAAKAMESTTRADYAGSNRGHILYPAVGWGTLMFEDLWPSYGDYDFNDLVVNYQVDLMMQNKNQAREMFIALCVRAIGGKLPYDLYLSLRGVRPDQIADIKMDDLQNGVQSCDLVKVNSGNSRPAILKFVDIKQNLNKPGGTTFLNVRPGEEMKTGDLTVVSFNVTFRNAISTRDLAFDTFDFFIARDDQQQEIHLAGFEPVLFGADRYRALRTQPTSNANTQSEYYYSNDNLVWGICIPAEIPHAYETRDFLTGYPNFAKWAQSGGVSNTDWYTDAPGNRNPENLVRMK